MTCPRTAELLSTDIAELRDSGGDLARHIETCAECSEAVARILAATDALGGVMSHAPSLDAKAVVAREGEASASRSAWHWIAPAWRKWGAWPAAGAAAAAVAAVTLYFATRTPEPVLVGEPWSPTDPPPRPLLAAAPGHDVVVIPTEDPDITIVWLVEEKPHEQ
ncbi:MAG: hypothetical protein OXI55_01715 [Gammaproteobacteria bacterium]|nr:hypothetical protein [Gammaproteobacteria bacterium]